ncbi:hypothetical protein [Hyalangium gracile]|uniref:hypothetical protein n=1 Tax=Hyalangium gracile TaxID=394092 RepID=UPI001CD002FF|nr:hypothetical protein [Hyalangium gracile]
MTSIRAVVLSTLLCVGVATSAAAKDKKPTGSARSSAASKSADKGPRWVEVSDPSGYTLKVPQEFTEKREEWSTSYRAVLPPDSAQLKAVVSVETLDELTPITNLEKAVESITSKRPGGVRTTIAEQRDVPSGYLVVIGPDYDIYTVHVIRNGKEVQVKAQCSGPATRLKELKEMCLSVKATK